MIYSIGHGNKKFEEFLNELHALFREGSINGTSPFSKYSPHFNHDSLKFELEKNSISYLYLGDILGGLPADKSCYTKGKVDYQLLKDKEFFKDGIQRLIKANGKNIDAVVMCSESKPEECHRSKLIGQALAVESIELIHITGLNESKTQTTIMNELTKGKGTVDMFGNETNFSSRKKYL